MCPVNIPPPLDLALVLKIVLSYVGPSFLMHYEMERPITHCSHKCPYHGWPEQDKSPTAWSENTVGTTAFLESEMLLLGIRSTPHVARCRKPGFNRTVMLITVTSNITGRKPHDRNVGLTFHPNTDSWEVWSHCQDKPLSQYGVLNVTTPKCNNKEARWTAHVNFPQPRTANDH
jgi:hypothetical protein